MAFRTRRRPLQFFSSSSNWSPGLKRLHTGLAREIKGHAIGNPNPGDLASQIRKTQCVYCQSGRFRLRQDKRNVVRSWVSTALDGAPEEVDGSDLYLDESVWKGTRGYLESVCVQLNGCYSHGYHDAAAVMIRRLVETLIIEAYDYLKRDREIKDSDGNYFMLSNLIDRAIDQAACHLAGKRRRR